jgi:hypothetical protein
LGNSGLGGNKQGEGIKLATDNSVGVSDVMIGGLLVVARGEKVIAIYIKRAATLASHPECVG